jgi:S1-C subfamily serine protease
MRKTFVALLSLALLVTLSGCTLPHLANVPSVTPQVVIVVATPTPAPVPTTGAAPVAEAADGSADSVEARRIAIYERAAPAVVNITTQVLRSGFFWGEYPEEGSGSGFLWDDLGHIVTNYHVIEGAQRIEVAFGEEPASPAEVVGADPMNDLAVLKVAAVPEGILPLEAGSSADLRVGQTAIAIGNPFGQFERTMTEGIISAVNRTIETQNSVLRGVIQTDASINRGNSGGPLLDIRGRLIGVNSAIYSPTGTSAGVGLAIPVDKVRRVVPALITDGRYPHPWLGIEELGYEISPALAQALDLPVETGLLVARLYRNSPADKAGIRSATDEVILGNRRYFVGGDIITAIDDRPLRAWEDLNAYLDEETEVGQTVVLRAVRDGQEATVEVVLEDTPASLQGQ